MSSKQNTLRAGSGHEGDLLVERLGIGRATALELARRGAKVIASARRRTELDSLIAEIREQGFETTAVIADVNVERDAASFVSKTVETYGGNYVLYEVWRSTDALESHFERPYTKALFAMFDRDLVRPITEGGLRFVADMDPQPRAKPATTDPTSHAACR